MADEPHEIDLDELRALIEKNAQAIGNLRRMIDHLNRLLAKAEPDTSHPSVQDTDTPE